MVTVWLLPVKNRAAYFSAAILIYKTKPQGGTCDELYNPRRCSRAISFEVKDNKVTNVHFVGGCSGNTQGVAALVEGMDIDEAIKRMKGIKCGPRPTSCPDQLATALEQYKAQQ